MPAIEVVDRHVVYENLEPQLRARHAWFPGLVTLPSGDLPALFAMGEAINATNVTTVVSRSRDSGRTMRPMIHLQRLACSVMNMAAVVVLGLLSAACEPEADRQETIRITYWTRSWWGDPAQYQDPNAKAIPVAQWQREQIDAFEAEHPHIKVELQTDPGGSGDKIRIAFAGRVPPDVFHGAPDNEFITWAALGFLEPIDAYLTDADRDDIYPTALSTCSYDGKVYAWPLYNHALCMVINRDLFRERGLTDQMPGPETRWTFAQFKTLAQKLTFDRDGDGATDVYGVGMHALDDNHIFLTAYLINHGAAVFDEQGRFVLGSETGTQGLKMLQRLIDEKIAIPGTTGYDYTAMRTLFVQQKIAMYLSSAGILIWAEDQAAKKTIEPFDWALVPLPSAEGIDPTSYLTVGTVLVSRQTDPARRDACMALARYLTGPQPNRFFWRMSSPRRSSPPPEDENLAVMMQQVARARNFMLPPRRLPDRFNLGKPMKILYQDALSERRNKSASDLLEDLEKKINGILDPG